MFTLQPRKTVAAEEYLQPRNFGCHCIGHSHIHIQTIRLTTLTSHSGHTQFTPYIKQNTQKTKKKRSESCWLIIAQNLQHCRVIADRKRIESLACPFHLYYYFYLTFSFAAFFFWKFRRIRDFCGVNISVLWLHLCQSVV